MWRSARAVPTSVSARTSPASKDHLLVDVLVDLVGQTTETLSSRPRRGRSPVDRAVATLRRAVQNLEQAPNLYIAMTRAYISGSPEVAHARVAMESSTRRWIDLALGESVVGDRDAIVRILEAVLFASMVGLVTGGGTPGEVADELELAARTLLRQR